MNMHESSVMPTDCATAPHLGVLGQWVGPRALSADLEIAYLHF
jgi:hypothetical protein